MTNTAVLSSLPPFLRPPHVEAGDEERIVIFHWVILATLGATILHAVMNPITDGGQLDLRIALFFLIPGEAVAYIIHKMGHSRPAGITMVIVITTGMVVEVALGGGMLSPMIIVLPLMILLASFLWDRQGSWILGLTIAVIALPLALAPALLPEPAHVLGPFRVWTVFVLTILVTLIFITLILRETERQISAKKDQEYLGDRVLMEDEIRINSRLAAVGSLAGGLGHEINNPLNAVLNYAELIRDDVELGSDMETYLMEIQTEAGRAVAVVAELLSWTAPSSGTMESLSALGLVQSVASLAQTALSSRGVTLDLQLPDDAATVEGDLPRLQEALLSVFDNAIRADR